MILLIWVSQTGVGENETVGLDPLKTVRQYSEPGGKVNRLDPAVEQMEEIKALHLK